VAFNLITGCDLMMMAWPDLNAPMAISDEEKENQINYIM
jgi:hypothetical protein